MFTTKGYFRDIMLSWFKSKVDRSLAFFTVLPKKVLTRAVGAFLYPKGGAPDGKMRILVNARRLVEVGSLNIILKNKKVSNAKEHPRRVLFYYIAQGVVYVKGM